MLGLLFEKYRTAKAKAVYERRLIESVMLHDPWNVYRDDEPPTDWHDLGARSGVQTRRTNLFDARRQARQLYATNAHARNIVNQMTNYTVGKGFAIKFDDAAHDDLWTKVARQIKWSRRRRQVVRRMLVDGETFKRKWNEPASVRFVQPEQIAQSASVDVETVDGVVTAKGDVETVVGYVVSNEFVPVSQMWHFKPPDCDMDETRGWPPLYDARATIQGYENWIKDRAMLNRLRSAIFLLRKHKHAGPGDIKKFQEQIRSGTFAREGGKTEDYRVLRPGTAIDMPANVEYEFISPNLDARDVRHDGRAMALLIAVWFQIPEYMATGDASNANFASTAVAEAPGIVAMASFQEFTGGQFLEFVAWLLGLTDANATITFPSLTTRDEEKVVKALEVEWRNGVISKQTWREKRCYDDETESERVLVEEGFEEPEPKPVGLRT